MTQAEDGNVQFSPNCIRHELPTRVFNVRGGVPVWSSTSAVTTALMLLLGIGVAKAANPTLLAETGGFLLGNAHRCGIAVERVEGAETLPPLGIRARRRLRIRALPRFSWRALFQTKTRTRFRPAQW